MKLKRLSLKNFGGYSEAEFSMQTIMVILEKNGFGKSTFLRAINFALDGDFEANMVKNGETSMTVTAEFENGFIVQRRHTASGTVSKMGYGTKVSAASKETVNNEISRLFHVPMDSLKVIASSSELFSMKANELGEFFLKHIPQKMTFADIMNYLDDPTPAMVNEIKKIIPSDKEFGSEKIREAYCQFDSVRKELAREAKKAEASIDGYDFTKKIRSQAEIQKEIDEIGFQLGTIAEKTKTYQNYLKLKEKRKKLAEDYDRIRKEFLEIQATKPDEAEKQRLSAEEDEIRKSISQQQVAISEAQNVYKTCTSVIRELEKGFCPLMGQFNHAVRSKGTVKCSKNWQQEINKLQTYAESLLGNMEKMKKSLHNNEARLKDILSQKERWGMNYNSYQKKCSKYNECLSIRASVFTVPQEPEKIDPEMQGQLLAKKDTLQKELKAAVYHQSMLQIKKKIPEIANTLNTFNVLTEAFSNKGIIMERNLKYYLDFFELQLKTKADKLGYIVKLRSTNGLHIQIGKSEVSLVDIERASKGEKAAGIFLILDLLTSITGIKMLFLDEVEILDNTVWKNLLNLLKENEGDFDHVILSGVNHTDTIEAYRQIMGEEPQKYLS